MDVDLVRLGDGLADGLKHVVRVNSALFRLGQHHQAFLAVGLDPFDAASVGSWSKLLVSTFARIGAEAIGVGWNGEGAGSAGAAAIGVGWNDRASASAGDGAGVFVGSTFS